MGSPGVAAGVEAAGDGLLDLIVVAALGRAVLTQHGQLVLDVVGELGSGQVEQAAGVAVPGHQAQRLLLAATADQDRRVWAPAASGRVSRGGPGWERAA